MSPTKSTSKSKQAGQEPWSDRHSRILTQAIADHIKAHRRDFYKVSGLAGEVDGHGGDRIRQKIDIMMKKFLHDNGAPTVRTPAKKSKAKVKVEEVDEPDEMVDD